MVCILCDLSVGECPSHPHLRPPVRNGWTPALRRVSIISEYTCQFLTIVARLPSGCIEPAVVGGCAAAVAGCKCAVAA